MRFMSVALLQQVRGAHARRVHFTRARLRLNLIQNYPAFAFLVLAAIKKDRLRFDPRPASVTARNVIMMNARHLRSESALDQIMAASSPFMFA